MNYVIFGLILLVLLYFIALQVANIRYTLKQKKQKKEGSDVTTK